METPTRQAARTVECDEDLATVMKEVYQSTGRPVHVGTDGVAKGMGVAAVASFGVVIADAPPPEEGAARLKAAMW